MECALALLFLVTCLRCLVLVWWVADAAVWLVCFKPEFAVYLVVGVGLVCLRWWLFVLYCCG